MLKAQKQLTPILASLQFALPTSIRGSGVSTNFRNALPRYRTEAAGHWRDDRSKGPAGYPCVSPLEANLNN